MSKDRPSGGTTQMIRANLEELHAAKTEKGKNVEFWRRIVGAVFLFVWLAVDTFERLAGIEHDITLGHTLKDVLPLVVGLALFAPDGLAVLGAAWKAVRK